MEIWLILGVVAVAVNGLVAVKYELDVDIQWSRVFLVVALGPLTLVSLIVALVMDTFDKFWDEGDDDDFSTPAYGG